MVRIAMSRPLERGRARRIFEISSDAWGHLLVGRTWTNGIRDGKHLPGYETVTAAVDIQPLTVQCVKAYERDRGLFVIPPSEYSIPAQFKDTTFALIRRGLPDHVGDIVIPCAELFRAYLATYSAVARLILAGHLIDGSNRLYDPGRSENVNGDARIHLGMHVPDRAAQVIARIAFDKAAGDAASAIVRDMIAARFEVHEYNIVMRPPFRGVSDWTMTGQYIGTGGWKRFLVHQLQKCTAHLPFGTLESYRDNPGGSPTGDPNKGRAFNKVTKHAHGAQKGIVSIYDTSDPKLQDIDLDAFDADDALVTPRARHTVLKNRNPVRKGASITVSTAESAKTFAAGRKTRGSPHTGVSFNFVAEDKGLETRPGTLSYFESALSELAEIGPRVRHVVHVSPMPLMLEWPGADVPWARIRGADNHFRARRVIVASVTIDADDHFVLFEIERRPRERSQATLAIVGEPSRSEIWKMFNASALGGGKLKDDAWLTLGLSMFRRLKPIKHDPDNKPADYAWRIFDKLRAELGSMQPPTAAPVSTSITA